MQGDKYQSAHHNEQAATRAIKAIKVAGLTKFEIRTVLRQEVTASSTACGCQRASITRVVVRIFAVVHVIVYFLKERQWQRKISAYEFTGT